MAGRGLYKYREYLNKKHECGVETKQTEEGDQSVADTELMYVFLKISKSETVVWGLRRCLSEEE